MILHMMHKTFCSAGLQVTSLLEIQANVLEDECAPEQCFVKVSLYAK